MKKLHAQKPKITSQHNLKVSVLYGAMVLALSAASVQAVASNGQQQVRPYTPKKIGDLEIYDPPVSQPAVITMVLDNSGSMGTDSIKEDYGEAAFLSCPSHYVNIRGGGTLPVEKDNRGWYYWSGRQKAYIDITTPAANTLTETAEVEVYKDDGTKAGSKVTYTRSYCMHNGNKRADRMTRLKDALLPVMANPKERLANRNHLDYKLGLGQFFTTSSGSGGQMIVPALQMNQANRVAMMQKIAGMKPETATPIANAYAEAGAYMLGETTNSSSNTTNYSGYDRADASIPKENGKYKSPINKTDSCEGHGIYFLTDGEPNGSVVASTQELMQKSLGSKSFTNVTNNLIDRGRYTAATSHHGWQLIGRYAKHLADPDKNPQGKRIRTATVGFGQTFQAAASTFDELTSIYNCARIPVTSPDVRNLCYMGETGFGFGEGGFTYAEKPEHIAGSLVDFLSKFGDTIEPVPGGTISIPNDPLNALRRLPYAYLPMVQPEVNKNLTKWEGNLKKYDTLFGTLYGQNTTRLYVPRARGATAGNVDYPSRLNSQVRDLWQQEDYRVNNVIANDRAEAGGARSRLPVPANEKQVTANGRTTTIPAVTDSRVVYVEDAGTLKRLQVRNRTLEGFDALSETYSVMDMAYILNFMGYAVTVNEKSVVLDNNGNPRKNQDGTDMTVDNYPANNRATAMTNLRTNLSNAPFTGNPVMGGVVHSSPVLASYGGPIESDGNVSSNSATRTDYLLYGSMDGALHAVHAHTGQEAFAFIPRTMFDNQRRALLFNSEHETSRVGEPYFGVDAPWTTISEHKQVGGRLQAQKISAYGGLRMGGVGLYGLRLQGNGASINSPQLQFAIAQDSQFARLGQTWSKPVEATIKTGRNQTQRVLVFSGGYDMCYENPRFKLGTNANNTDATCNKDAAQGNAIYMINADTGAYIAHWTNTGVRDGRAEMKHSFVSEPVVRDRNNNGYADVIYAADLGGQIFRIDLAEEVPSARMTRRVVRVFNANATDDTTLASDHIPYRFYESPQISFYDHNNSTVALINISSGDRSSPVHNYRASDTDAKIAQNANRIYGIFDRDITTSRFYTTPSNLRGLVSNNLTHRNLHAYDTATLATASDTDRKTLMDELKNERVHGWYYTMTRFENRTNVPHLKSIGSSVVNGGIYFTSIYNRDYKYFETNTCDAKILGATERQLFCLPWGICAQPSGALIPQSNNGTLGYIKAGPGIQDLAMTTVTGTANTATNLTTIISHQTIAERMNTQAPTDAGSETGANKPSATTGTFNGDGHNDPHGENDITSANHVLKVQRWYDLQTAEANQ